MTQPLHIDNSTLSALSKCDTMALLRYGFGWTSEGESAALQCGTAIHTALEVYFKTASVKQAKAAFQAAYEAWSDANIPAAPERHQMYLLRYAYENVADILATWLKRHPLNAEPYKVYPDLVEIGFSFPLADGVLFYGRYDAIVEERNTGMFYVLDHKAQPLWSKILTPTGWRAMETLQVGDTVIGKSGRPTRVTGIYPQGTLPTYRVVFKDGGTTYCSGDHLWTVASRQGEWQTCTLDAIRKRLRDNPSVRLSVPVSEAVQFEAPARKLPIDPYVMGALIGDGYLGGNSIVFCSAEAEMVEEFRRCLSSSVELKKCKGANHSWIIKPAEPFAGNYVLNHMKGYKLHRQLSATKFIPSDYQFALLEDRISLLQGLMDTDGGVYNGHCFYDSVSLTLIEQVVALVRSLGGVAQYHRRTGTKQQAYRINLRLPDGIVPFRLRRKRDKLQPKKWQLRRTIAAIEPFEPQPSQCIQVAAVDGLYITDDFIVTHNTTGQITADWAHTFKTSTQITGYVWAAQHLLGKPVAGAIINGIQISKLPDVKFKANGEAYRCKEHGIGVDECRLAHTKESLAITQRDPEQIANWKSGATRLARRWQKLLTKYPTAESVSTAQQQGMFSGACRYCDFRNYCEVGRPADRLQDMLVHRPWKPFDPNEVKKGTSK